MLECRHELNNVLTKHEVQVEWHKISAIDPRHPDRNCPCHLSVELLTSNLWLRWITKKSKTQIATEMFWFHTFWHPKAKGETWNINRETTSISHNGKEYASEFSRDIYRNLSINWSLQFLNHFHKIIRQLIFSLKVQNLHFLMNFPQ